MTDESIQRSHPIPRWAAWAALVFLAAPILTALPVSLTPERYLSFPSDGLSLRHYREFFGGEDWLLSLGRSVAIGGIASAIALALGTAAAIGLWRWLSRWSAIVRMLLLLPMIVPAIVTALAFYWTWSKFGLLDTYWGVVTAHAVLALPYVLIPVSASLATLDPALELAARGMGAGLMQTVFRVILPNIRAGIFSAFVFAFIASWDEIVVTMFITQQDVITLPRMMWNGIQDNVDPIVAVCATVLTVVSVLVLSIQAAWARLRRPSEVDP